MEQPLLTIGIPTYNRAIYLDRCLNSILIQLDGVRNDIELIVANNAATDNTAEIVKKYAAKTPITYIEREVNGGPDATSSICFQKAAGKYVWILGDDEFLIAGSLKLIIDLLKNNDFGDLYLHCIPFHRDEDVDLTPVKEAKIVRFTNPLEFIEKIHYYITFISGNIINKSLLPADFDYDDYMHTNIVQVGWTMHAVFAGKENAFVETPLIAAKQNNSGGYRFITTFGENYNRILKSLISKGFEKKILRITNKNLIKSYFPPNIIKLLYYENRFDSENHFRILFKNFWRYPDFWQILFPTYFKYWIKKLTGQKIEKFK